MKKITLLAFVAVTTLVSSCTRKNACPAYGNTSIENHLPKGRM